MKDHYFQNKQKNGAEAKYGVKGEICSPFGKAHAEHALFTLFEVALVYILRARKVKSVWINY